MNLTKWQLRGKFFESVTKNQIRFLVSPKGGCRTVRSDVIVHILPKPSSVAATKQLRLVFLKLKPIFFLMLYGFHLRCSTSNTVTLMCFKFIQNSMNGYEWLFM